MRRASLSENAPIGWVRLLAIVLVLLGQLLAGSRAAAEENNARQWLALDRAMVLCQAGHVPGRPRAPAPCDMAHDQAIVTAGQTMLVAILADAPALPAPTLWRRIEAGRVPPARAPPTPVGEDAYPRGPPGHA